MSNEEKMRAALKARLKLSEDMRNMGRPPHPDYWVQSICEVEAQMREALALPITPPAPAVPGWKWVPVEPTEEMLAAVPWPGCARTDWSHMLAAAPTPPTPAAQSQTVRGMPDVATWLWFRFVDYCRKQSMTPRHQKGLFAIVHDLRTMLASTTPPVHAAAQEPVTLTDSYAGVIAWIGDKQCKLPVTEDAIKHEHTPGVAMRNAAHQCVQEVTAALREKQAKATP